MVASQLLDREGEGAPLCHLISSLQYNRKMPKGSHASRGRSEGIQVCHIRGNKKNMNMVHIHVFVQCDASLKTLLGRPLYVTLIV